MHSAVFAFQANAIRFKESNWAARGSYRKMEGWVTGAAVWGAVVSTISLGLSVANNRREKRLEQLVISQRLERLHVGSPGGKYKRTKVFEDRDDFWRLEGRALITNTSERKIQIAGVEARIARHYKAGILSEKPYSLKTRELPFWLEVGETQALPIVVELMLEADEHRVSIDTFVWTGKAEPFPYHPDLHHIY